MESAPPRLVPLVLFRLIFNNLVSHTSHSPFIIAFDSSLALSLNAERTRKRVRSYRNVLDTL